MTHSSILQKVDCWSGFCRSLLNTCPNSLSLWPSKSQKAAWFFSQTLQGALTSFASYCKRIRWRYVLWSSKIVLSNCPAATVGSNLSRPYRKRLVIMALGTSRLAGSIFYCSLLSARKCSISWGLPSLVISSFWFRVLCCVIFTLAPTKYVLRRCTSSIHHCGTIPCPGSCTQCCSIGTCKDLYIYN